MITELDNVKSTITISLGTKNRLRNLKGSRNYEDFINYLIRLRNESVYEPIINTIEFQQFQRKKGLFYHDNFNILFSYNKYNRSPNFRFDITIEVIRENGQKINLNEFIRKLSNNSNKDYLNIEYRLYFQLLEKTIQEEIEPRYKHNGRFEDYFSWEKELEILNMPKKAFEEDVMEKLRQFESRAPL